MKKTIAVLALVVAAGALLWAAFHSPVSQAQVPPEIILFTGENFTGNEVHVTGTLIDMPKGAEDGPDELRGWNDAVRSIIVVSGTWRLYQHGRCNTEIDKDEGPEEVLLSEKAAAKGWSTLVSAHPDGPREYANPATGGWDSDVSSVELVSAERTLPPWAVLER